MYLYVFFKNMHKDHAATDSNEKKLDISDETSEIQELSASHEIIILYLNSKIYLQWCVCFQF